MPHAPNNPPLRQAALIGRGVALELLRRKDVYVLLLLMGLFLAWTALIQFIGIKNPATGTFLLNFGLTLAYLGAHALTLLLAGRQLPDELENRTLHPLLAKPLRRGEYLLGKWAACSLCGAACLLILQGAAWSDAPKLEVYHFLLLLQLVLLECVSLGMLAALAIFGSLWMPRGVNLLVWGLLVLFGGTVLEGLRGLFAATAGAAPLIWLTRYVPDFTKLNLITRYTDGIEPLGAGLLLGLIIYGVVVAAAAHCAGLWLFRRRAL